MTGYPTKRDSVEIDSRAVELLTRAFPGMTVAQTGDQAWDVRLPDGTDEVVTRGDRIIYEPDTGFTIDRDTKDLPAQWAAKEADERKRGAEYRERERAERDAREAAYQAFIADDSLKTRVAKALTDYASTTDHYYDCASRSEGQNCCIDFDHDCFMDLLDVIVNAVSPPDPDES